MNYAQYYRPPQGSARPKRPKPLYQPKMIGAPGTGYGGIMGPRRGPKPSGFTNFSGNLPMYQPPMYGGGYGSMGGYGGGGMNYPQYVGGQPVNQYTMGQGMGAYYTSPVVMQQPPSPWVNHYGRNTNFYG